MRMRKKKNGAKRMELCADIHITDPAAQKGAWRTLAGERLLCAEIGCGKGSFILEMAKRHPDRFFIGFEKIADVIVLAMEKVEEAGLDNVVFVCDDAEHVTDIFADGELDELYLNFSDPWPKKRHANRRLTYIGFLERYKIILKDGGKIFFKTDNRPLFDFSLEQFEAAHIALSDVTNDLHHSEYEKDNIHTEYENNFSAKGFSINRLVGTVDKRFCLTPDELAAYDRRARAEHEQNEADADTDAEEAENTAKE